MAAPVSGVTQGDTMSDSPPNSATRRAPPRRGHGGHGGQGFWAMALGSVGVVYGDIGTSPLYALKASLEHVRVRRARRRPDIIGIVSLLIWALIFIVTVKYVMFIMRADNKGEGGTLSLMALAQHAVGRRTLPIFLLGVAGAALFSGDAIITPAISVLSAVEGLKLPAVSNTSTCRPISCRSPSSSSSRYSSCRAAAQRRSPLSSARSWSSFLRHRRHGHDRTSSTSRGSSRRSIRAGNPSSCSRTARKASRLQAWYFWPSPARKRSMPTWAIWPQADPDRLGRIRAAVTDPELSRAGRPRAGPSDMVMRKISIRSSSSRQTGR